MTTRGDGRDVSQKGRSTFLYEGRTLDERLPEAVKRIVDGFDPLKVILFGSLTRGEAGYHSDVDLLVVMPDGIEDKHRVTVEILRAEGRAVPQGHRRYHAGGDREARRPRRHCAPPGPARGKGPV